MSSDTDPFEILARFLHREHEQQSSRPMSDARMAELTEEVIDRASSLHEDPVRVLGVPAVETSVPSRPRWIVAAAMVLAVFGVTAGVLWGRSGETVVRSSGTFGASETGSDYTCGSELPVPVLIPSATEGPTPGASADAPTPEVGQLVQHWETTDGPIETRWPARVPQTYDSTIALDEVDWRVADGPSSDLLEVFVGKVDTARTVIVGTAGELTSPCDVLEILVEADGLWHPLGVRLDPADSGPDGANGMISPQVDLRPLIDRGLAVPEEAARGGLTICEASADLRSASEADSPAGVLAEITSRGLPLATSGYVELVDISGEVVAYGQQLSANDLWTSIIWIDRQEEGIWRLNRWESTEC